MSHKSYVLLLVLLALSISTNVAAALGGGGRTGGWQPIKNPADPEVVDTAKYAVNEHNRRDKASLKFQKVVKGEYQVVAGMNYRLVISAKDAAAVNKYQAEVWVKPWLKFKNLTSFEKLN